jgi:hypothetical protein
MMMKNEIERKGEIMEMKGERGTHEKKKKNGKKRREDGGRRE